MFDTFCFNLIDFMWIFQIFFGQTLNWRNRIPINPNISYQKLYWQKWKKSYHKNILPFFRQSKIKVCQQHHYSKSFFIHIKKNFCFPNVDNFSKMFHLFVLYTFSRILCNNFIASGTSGTFLDTQHSLFSSINFICY